MKNSAQNDLLSALAIFTFLGGVFLILANRRERRNKLPTPSLQTPAQTPVKALSQAKLYGSNSYFPFGDSIISLN